MLHVFVLVSCVNYVPGTNEERFSGRGCGEGGGGKGEGEGESNGSVDWRSLRVGTVDKSLLPTLKISVKKRMAGKWRSGYIAGRSEKIPTPMRT